MMVVPRLYRGRGEREEINGLFPSSMAIFFSLEFWNIVPVSKVFVNIEIFLFLKLNLLSKVAQNETTGSS